LAAPARPQTGIQRVKFIRSFLGVKTPPPPSRDSRPSRESRAYQMVGVLEGSAIRGCLTITQRAIQREIVQRHAVGCKIPGNGPLNNLPRRRPVSSGSVERGGRRRPCRRCEGPFSAQGRRRWTFPWRAANRSNTRRSARQRGRRKLPPSRPPRRHRGSAAGEAEIASVPIQSPRRRAAATITAR